MDRYVASPVPPGKNTQSSMSAKDGLTPIVSTPGKRRRDHPEPLDQFTVSASIGHVIRRPCLTFTQTISCFA
jgi:hypothetical protein